MNAMTKKYKIGLFILLPLALAVLVFLFFQGTNFAVLNPKGEIASQQRDLMLIATLLMLIVVIPVFILTFLISWRYREGNHKKSKYTPDHDSNHALEAIWWTIPFIIIVVLSGIIWKSSHQLDPFKALEHEKKPITVQVVALEWKWLFIYPDQGVATVNYMQIPEDTPINFRLTSDAPMNSLWIPQLGGQVYTMSGMETQLHLIADEPGEYAGQSANLSGDGFAGMKFKVNVTNQSEFDSWVENTYTSSKSLDSEEYNNLAKPSKNNAPAVFAYNDKQIYGNVIAKYRAPAGSSEEKHGH